MKHKQQKITLLFLGNFIFDARCINMLDCLINHNNVSIIYEDQKFDDKIERYPSVRLFPIKLPKSGVTKYFTFHKQATKILTTLQSNVLIACDLFSLASIKKFTSEAQLIYDCREIYSQLSSHKSRPLHRFVLKQYEKYFIYSMDDILFTAKSDRDYIQALYPKLNLKTNFHILYNYPKYCKYQPSKLLHQLLNLPKSKKIILYQGVVQRGRGILQLIKFLPMIKDVVGVCLGEGEHLKYFKAKAKEYKLDNELYFLDKVNYNELMQYTASADLGWLLINPDSMSNKFALPNKFIEYILMGLPVISSRLPNVIPILEKYNLGAVVNFNSLADIRGAVLNLLDNPVGGNYMHNIAKDFVWENQKNVFLNIIDK